MFKNIKNITVLLLFHTWWRLSDYPLRPSFPLFASPAPLLYNCERELKTVQIQMTAEENKIQKRGEMIKGLKSDKLQPEQEVTHLKELLAPKAEKHIGKQY